MWKYALTAYLGIHAIGYTISERQSMEEILQFSLPEGRSAENLGTSNQPDFLNCNGYLSDNPEEKFCSEDVPQGWRDFEFNGEQFYAVPLASTKRFN